MEKKNYYIYKLSMLTVTILSIIITVIIFFLTPLITSKSVDILNYLDSLSIIKMIIFILGYCILHELLHSLGYYMMGGKWNKIIYGIKLELGIFYCL